jgi:hypothetical protein
VDKLFGLLTFPYPLYGRTLAFLAITVLGTKIVVWIKVPVWLVSDAPSAEFDTIKEWLLELQEL